MKEFKGTKGEWTYEHYGREDWDRHIVIEPINTHLYDVDEESESNARLIAAAPNLLEACINIADEYEKFYDKSGDFLSRSNLDCLKAAINKALNKTI
jgi:hypothetical protein